MGRLMAGRTDLTLRDVDETGTLRLVEAAEKAGVERFVFVSLREALLRTRTPLATAKRTVEQRLQESTLEAVIVRCDLYQEIWLSPLSQFDWPNRSVTIFGKGNAKASFVAMADVAQAVVRLAAIDDPPRVIEVGGAVPISPNEVADAFEAALEAPIKRRHVPRVALRVGSLVLSRFQPAVASVMGLALSADVADSTVSADGLRSLDIQPRSVRAYVEEAVAAHRQAPDRAGIGIATPS
jgi:nucleoside-diphosphate-sugar epimerase